MNNPDINVTLNSLITPIFSLRLISNGMEPMTSITANSVNVTVRSSFKVKAME